MFDPIRATIRFGMGLGPRHALPQDIDALLMDVTGPDAMAAAYPIAVFSEAAPSIFAFQEALKHRKAQEEGTAAFDAAQADEKRLRDLAVVAYQDQVRAQFFRAIETPIGFRERLVRFWADHFTVIAPGVTRKHLVAPYIEEAIRPHVGLRFADMLRAAVTHPAMLIYLQQARSIGPNSVVGVRQGKGLNENLARELLELHTLGVGGGYLQADVRQLAELLAGISYKTSEGVFYDTRRAEPGAETVMGVTYSDASERAVIDAALADLAVHPATARHIAAKLAAHFVADVPDADLVAAIEAAFIRTDGDLMACYAAMLAHPAAWADPAQKVRPPFDFIAGGMRALGVRATDLQAMEWRKFRGLTALAMRTMGQPWQAPGGPDGWADTAADWIIPQTMAGRISWAMVAPTGLLQDLPDPREVVHWALGPEPEQAVVFAASSAETTRDGIGVIFASPAFNRR